MLKGLMREITLSVQTRSGINATVLLWAGLIALALMTAFVFLCVAAFEWLSVLYGSVFAGLIMAGVFALIAAIGAMVCALARRRIRERAILERAARAHAPSWLLDPKILGVAVQAGRAMGWQRIVPVALFGFMAAQWAREYRDKRHQDL
jgi:uncharacterized membrane protein